MNALYRLVPPQHEYPGSKHRCRKPVTVWRLNDGSLKITSCEHAAVRLAVGVDLPGGSEHVEMPILTMVRGRP